MELLITHKLKGKMEKIRRSLQIIAPLALRNNNGDNNDKNENNDDDENDNVNIDSLNPRNDLDDLLGKTNLTKR